LEHLLSHRYIPDTRGWIGVTVDREWSGATDLRQRTDIDLPRHVTLESELRSIDGQ
jgi:hypothetical protein